MSDLTTVYNLLLSVKQNKYNKDSSLVNSVYENKFSTVANNASHISSLFILPRGTEQAPSITEVNLNQLLVPRLLVLQSHNDELFRVEWEPLQAKPSQGTIKLNSVPTNNSSLSINGLTYTFTSGSIINQSQVGIKSTTRETALELAKTINNDKRIGSFDTVKAFACTDTIYLYALTVGSIGNQIPISVTGAPFTASGELLSGGNDTLTSKYPGVNPPGHIHVLQYPICKHFTTRKVNLHNTNTYSINVSVFAVG